MSDDCGQNGVCAEAPGCLRHWAERVREVMDERDAAKATVIDAALIHAKLIQERDEARDELKKIQDDFQSVWESRDTVIEERERARQACNAYWHDLMRIGSLCEQTDDEYPLKAVERTVREFAQFRRDFVRVADALGLVSADDMGRIGAIASVEDIVTEARLAAKALAREPDLYTSLRMSCEEPPTGCECAGCSYARERGGAE